MRSYQNVFANKKKAMIPFFVLGDPDEERSFQWIMTAVQAGADILELGVPFSDPIADGPTIQKADIRALQNGMNCQKAIHLIRRIRKETDVPIGLLMYYNLICHYGREQFYADAAQAGVNSVLVADLCVDDAQEVAELVTENGLDSVYMVTSNTSQSRRKKIAQICTGFIYTVALLGVTGARAELSDEILPLVRSLKELTQVPICVGFGVSKPEHARQLVQAGADGVIIGSAIVKMVQQYLDRPDQGQKQLALFMNEVKRAMACN